MTTASNLSVLVLASFIALPLAAQQTELRSLANGLADDIAASGKKSIAVVDFTDLKGNPTELGRFLAEEFSVALTRTHKGFEVIDRAHLKAILAEHKLASTGLIDPATAKKLGQIVGADILLTGTMTPFSETVRIAVKALVTDTARIVAADSADLPKTKTINELIGGTPDRHDDAHDGPPRMGRKPENQSSTSAPMTRQPAESQPDMRFARHQGGTPHQTAITDEFVYELTECKGLGDSVRCSFVVTNRGRDRGLSHACIAPEATWVNHSNVTVAFDNLGNEAVGGDCSLADKYKNENYESVVAQLISGVPVRASILFKKVNPSASAFAVLTIRGGWGDLANPSSGTKLAVSFRNVPIAR